VNYNACLPIPFLELFVGSLKIMEIHFESIERGDPILAISGIEVCNLLSFRSINFVDTDPDFDGNQ
jgi:hypothetical protein